jgi:sigma-B regulation protein RsbU (phosphoserine phosphatase)
MPTDDHFINELLSSRRSQFANDTSNIRHYQKTAGTDLDKFSAFAHIPIAGEGEPAGVLSVFSRSIVGLFTEELLNLLTSLAGQLALAVQLVDERGAKEHEREEKEIALLKNANVVHEMELAKQIQLSLLPESPPRIPGIQIASLTVSAEHVGGDYYDFFTRDDRIVDAVIADVSGHNVGAALIMVETRSVLRVQVNINNSPGEILASLNDLLLNDLSRAELFITMFYVKYDTATQWLSYASAGHNHPLLFSASNGTCLELDAEGLILGVKEAVLFEEKSIQLDIGDVLLLYTDGLTETTDPDGEMFGIERLTDILREFHSTPPQNLIDIIYRELVSFAGGVKLTDDVSIVAMRVEQSYLDQQD